MATEIVAPYKDKMAFIGRRRVFLAGSIEMGKAERWQERVAALLPENVIAFNPYRADWDSSWVQDIGNPQFYEQVNWELHHMLDESHVVFFYFQPDTLAPITLAELGLALASLKRCVVVCPPGYWRRGNVQIMCDRYAAVCLDSLEDGIIKLKEYLVNTHLVGARDEPR